MGAHRHNPTALAVARGEPVCRLPGCGAPLGPEPLDNGICRECDAGTSEVAKRAMGRAVIARPQDTEREIRARALLRRMWEAAGGLPRGVGRPV